MVVDVGAVRSGITVVGGGAVRFTTTVAVGGYDVVKSIKTELPEATHDDIRAIQNVEGLAYRGNANVQASLDHLAVELTKQIERYFLYWQTRKDAGDTKLPQHPIEKVFLSGGSANIAGLPEHISRQLRIPVQRADVWTNVLSVAEHVPPISYGDSLGYAASIGLALHRDR
jgi:Tfp pilus assembly PilM family ATPase